MLGGFNLGVVRKKLGCGDLDCCVEVGKQLEGGSALELRLGMYVCLPLLVLLFFSLWLCMHVTMVMARN
jgi:hypothetical protein